jgi:hypothetical protein
MRSTKLGRFLTIVHSVTALSVLSSLTLVTATALAILEIPGYLVATVPAALALQD